MIDTPVRTVMSSPNALVRPRATVRAAAEALRDVGARSALVVDADGSVVGVVTERALLVAVAGDAERDDPVGPHASGSVPTVDPETAVREAADLLQAERLGTLPVTDADADGPVGVVTAADVAPFVSAGRTAATREPRRPSGGRSEAVSDRDSRHHRRSAEDRRDPRSVAEGVTSGR